MIGERRRPVLERELIVRVALAWALMAVLLPLTAIPMIWNRQFADGDDIMRLIQVRDWLAGQSWFDVTQHRIDAPFGAVMHWSRLVDVPLAMIVWPLSPIIGQAAAEQVAAVLVPLLTLFVVMLLIGRMAWRLFDEEATTLACIVVALSAPLLYQLRPMRIDHHGWQIACALLAVNALMARDARRGGWIAGAALALWLSISMEAMPMVIAICGIALVRWLRCWGDRQWLVSILQSLAVCSGALYLLTHGTAAGGELCDAIAPAHLAALGVMALGATGLGRVEVSRPWLFVLLVLGSTGLASVLVLLQIAPQCAGGSFGGMDQVAHDMWLANVSESKPIWDHPLDLMVQILLPPVLAIIVCLRLAMQSGAWLHRWHLEYAALIAAAMIFAIALPRSCGVVIGLAAVPLGYQLRLWLRSLRTLHKPRKQAMAVAGIVAALLPALPLTLLMQAAPAQSAAPADATLAQNSACDLDAALPAIGGKAATILAPIDMGPAILLDSPHSVVATAHHRAHRGIGDTIRFFTGDEDQARAILASRKVGYVMLCPSMREMDFYRAQGKANFAQRLTDGDAPDWLMPIEGPAPNGMKLWRVIG